MKFQLGVENWKVNKHYICIRYMCQMCLIPLFPVIAPLKLYKKGIKCLKKENIQINQN